MKKKIIVVLGYVLLFISLLAGMFALLYEKLTHYNFLSLPVPENDYFFLFLFIIIGLMFFCSLFLLDRYSD